MFLAPVGIDMPSTHAIAPSFGARYITGWPSFLSAIGGPSQV